jgi:hypothetical protein
MKVRFRAEHRATRPPADWTSNRPEHGRDRLKEERLAPSGTTQDLAALEQARAQLEAALSADENWRALRKSEGRAGSPESAARSARNTRLKMALAQNPLYQAWRHLGEAIAALHESRERAGASAGEGDAEAVSQGKFGSLARRLDVSRAGGAAREPGHATPSAPLPANDQSPAAPPPAGTAPQPAADPAAGGDPAPRRWADEEPDEATVTFVRREPLLPSVGQPEDISADRTRGLFARLRALADAPRESRKTASEGFAASGPAEEAEVVIVSAEDAQAGREAEASPGDTSPRTEVPRRVRKTRPGG